MKRRKLQLGIELFAFLLIGYTFVSGRPPAHSQSPQENIAIEMMHDKDQLGSLSDTVKSVQDQQLRIIGRMVADEATINDLKVQAAGGGGSRTWIDGGFGTALLAILGLQVKNAKSKGEDS